MFLRYSCVLVLSVKIIALRLAFNSVSFRNPFSSAVNKTSPLEFTRMDLANFLNSFSASISCRISPISSWV